MQTPFKSAAQCAKSTRYHAAAILVLSDVELLVARSISGVTLWLLAGDKPEVPGYCIREKDLQACDDNDDCQLGTRCLPLDHASELYCLPIHVRRPTSAITSNNNDEDNDVTLVGGGLGSALVIFVITIIIIITTEAYRVVQNTFFVRFNFINYWPVFKLIQIYVRIKNFFL